MKKRTLSNLWKDQLTAGERDLSRIRLQMIDNLINYPTNPRFDETRQNQLITKVPPTK